MTPDMRRLALAVAKVRWHDPAPSDEEWTDEALANFECEAIVRAVLTELREPTGNIVRAGLEAPGDSLTVAFIAMIDHILAEPATA